ncbi:hypothetical protein [Enterococcus saccharolyticus]|uniref:hypothetical protein n=1 Tax=Enterococcus saccharolyticus TaxID=41997 RepID=UPI0039E1D0D3
MLKHKVIYPFIEKDKKYWLGDIYTSDDEKRIKQLSTKNNKLKKVLIEPIKEGLVDETAIKTNKKVDGAPEEEKAK